MWTLDPKLNNQFLKKKNGDNCRNLKLTRYLMRFYKLTMVLWLCFIKKFLIIIRCKIEVFIDERHGISLASKNSDWDRVGEIRDQIQLAMS